MVERREQMRQEALEEGVKNVWWQQVRATAGPSGRESQRPADQGAKEPWEGRWEQQRADGAVTLQSQGWAGSGQRKACPGPTGAQPLHLG